MTTKIKTTLLTAFFFFALLSGLQAQDKYEFATVTQVSRINLEVSIQGKPLEIIPVANEIKYTGDHQQLFALIDKMQDEGWEVFNTLSSAAMQFTVTLRRKKKN